MVRIHPDPPFNRATLFNNLDMKVVVFAKASCDEARVVGTLGYVLHRVFIREDSDGDAQARELPMVL